MTVPESVADAGLRAALVQDLDALTFTVRGGCLAPVVRDGQVVRLVDARRLRPRTGDLVLVETSAGPRLHRLLLRLGGRLLTSPDHGPWDAFGPRLLAVAPGYRSRRQAARSFLQGLVGRLRRAG